MNHTYYVYILASRSRNLYTGVTNDLQRRMIEHRQGLIPGFTTRYRIFRLVYFEEFADIRNAIAREKEIKAWRREKKLWLINRRNRAWQDLADPNQSEKQIPHRRSQTPRPGSGWQSVAKGQAVPNRKLPARPFPRRSASQRASCEG